MYKILKAYIANPTLGNALKVVRHAKKHPMSTCLFNADETTAYYRAVTMIADAPMTELAKASDNNRAAMGA